jgi:hypothetical protein
LSEQFRGRLTRDRALAWSRSLYWRIAVSFAVFTLGMLLVQNMLFRYLLDRPDPSFLSPNAMALLSRRHAAVPSRTSFNSTTCAEYAGTRQPCTWS